MSRAKSPAKSIFRKEKAVDLNKTAGKLPHHLQCTLVLPKPFIILCSLARTTPESLITGFIHDISFTSYERESLQPARNLLVEYFIDRGYGKTHLSEKDWRLFFNDLQALCFAWPTGSDPQTIKISEQWRKCFYAYLKIKWVGKRKSINKNS